MDEFNEVRRQIESNDPDLVELKVKTGDYARHGGDWKHDGNSIGRNTRLKKITFCGAGDYSRNFAEEDSEKFFRGVACSQSIKKLRFDQCDLFGGEVFRILRPLFKRNQVDCLEFDTIIEDEWGATGMSPECSRSLAIALGEFDSLKEFKLSLCSVDDNETEELIRALAGHAGLRKLDLRFTCIGRNACAALAHLLQDPNSKLFVLDLGDSGINNEGADALAPGLAGNSTLKDLNLDGNFNITVMGWHSVFDALQRPSCRLEELSLSVNNGINDADVVSSALTNNITLKSLKMHEGIYGHNITVAGWRALFRFLREPNCSLEELGLRYIGELCDGVIFLSNALNKNRSLKSLDLSYNRITTAGWQAFSSVLESASSGLEVVNLRYTGINDEAINSIANALVDNTKLRELNLCNNGQVTNTGWQAFSGVLQSTNSALEKLNLSYNVINADTLSSFANSVTNNSKLKELVLDHENSNGITFNGWDAFSHVLCNASSIMNTYQSNHKLEKVSNDEDAMPQKIRSLLELNRDNSKFQAARIKIIKTHFSGNFDVHPFVGMDCKVLPRAIAWLGKDGRSNVMNGLYGFIRSVPQLVDAEVNATNQTEDQ